MVEKMKFLPLVIVIGLLLALAGGVSLGLAQGPKPPEKEGEPQGEVSIAATVGSKFSYQGVLKENNNPVTGSRDMTFRLYSDDTCATQVGVDIAKPGVEVANGFFSVEVEVDQGHFDGQGLWLEVDVGGTAIACQEILPVPYALSLRPGAMISSTGTVLTLNSSISGNDGIHIESAGDDGVHVENADDDGIFINSAGDDGVYVNYAGGDGIAVGSANKYGVWVYTAQDDAIRVEYAQNDGLVVHDALNHGIVIGNAGDFGLYVMNNATEGVVVENAGWDGVYVTSAVNRAVYANTSDPDHEWGLNTPDKLYVGTTMVSGGPLMLIAQNGDAANLEPGDVVVATGLGAPFADSPSPITLVRRADTASSQAVAGVVYRRFEAKETVREHEYNGEISRYTDFDIHTTEGAIAPGEYLLIVVTGVCEVKVDAADGPIHPGDVLSVSNTQGLARRAQPLTLEGVSFYPPGITFGTALEPLDEGTGLIHMLVTLR
jgi:hypothetical protein